MQTQDGSKTTQAPQAPTASATGHKTEAPQGPGAAAPSSMNIMNVLNAVGAGTITLSAAGRQYLETLKTELLDTTHQRSGEEPMQIRKLTTPAETYLVIANKHAVALCFADAQYSDSDPVIGITPPMTKLAPEIFNRVRAEYGPEYKLVQVIMITEDDYMKASEMIAWLRRLFMTVSHTDVNPVASMFRTSNIRVSVDNNLERTRNYVSSRLPHGVVPAFDYGITLNISDVDPRDGKITGTRPIAAVCGRTDFVSEAPKMGPNGTMVQYTPVSQVTHIESDIPSPNMLGLLLPLAMQEFINNGLWKAGYYEITKDRTNLGNLIFNINTGTLHAVENAAQVEEVVFNFLKAPVLSINLLHGRAHIPSLENFTEPGNPECSRKILETFTNFFGQITFSSPAPVVSVGMTIEGTFKHDSPEPKDSRHIDYLNMLKAKRQPEELRELLAIPGSLATAQVRARKVKELVPNFKALYANYECILDSRVVADLQAALVQFVNVHSKGRGDAVISGINLSGASSFTQEAMGRSSFGGSMVGSMGGIGGYYNF